MRMYHVQGWGSCGKFSRASIERESRASRPGLRLARPSQQLTMLREAGMLTSRRDGKTVYYRANPAGIGTALTELQAYLTMSCPSEQVAGRSQPTARLRRSIRTVSRQRPSN
ncbi:ArsR/SmtB family transcription factor [Crossiella sp. NPDC003009]